MNDQDYEIIDYVEQGDTRIPVKRYKAAAADGYYPASCSKAGEELDALEEQISHIRGLTRGSAPFKKSYYARRRKSTDK